MKISFKISHDFGLKIIALASLTLGKKPKIKEFSDGAEYRSITGEVLPSQWRHWRHEEVQAGGTHLLLGFNFPEVGAAYFWAQNSNISISRSGAGWLLELEGARRSLWCHWQLREVLRTAVKSGCAKINSYTSSESWKWYELREEVLTNQLPQLDVGTFFTLVGEKPYGVKFPEGLVPAGKAFAEGNMPLAKELIRLWRAWAPRAKTKAAKAAFEKNVAMKIAA